MPVQPKDFLDHAKNVLASEAGSSEMNYRAASSKAHYAAYHAASYLSTLCAQPDPLVKGTHKRKITALGNGNISYFGAELDRRIRALGVVLGQTRDIRTEADYYLDEEFEERKARTCVMQSEGMLRRVSEIESELNKENAS